MSIARLARVCAMNSDEQPAREAELQDFRRRLDSLPEYPRKLLAHIADLAYRKHGSGRKPGAAYFPELHETSGLDVDAMYELLRQIAGAGFIEIESEYPFEDVHIAGTLMPEIVRFCQAENVSLRDVIVDSRFDLFA